MATTASIMDTNAVSLGGSILLTRASFVADGRTAEPPAAHWLQVKELPLLAPHAERLRHTADQLAACLRVLAAMVRGEERPRR